MTGPTSTSTVSGRLHQDLRAGILTGRLSAGEPLPSERRLSDEHGVSRHAVREALKRLEQAGLIAISQGGATRVRDWRRNGGLELLLALGAEGDAPAELHIPRATYEMRSCIGADAARLCARRATAAQRAQLRAHAERIAALEELPARAAHYDLLWDGIVEGSGNIAYRLALTTLVARQRLASVAPEAIGGELADPDAIRSLAQAIGDGDGDRARDRARELLDRSVPEA